MFRADLYCASKNQTTGSDLSGTGILMPVNPHKIKMSEGLSDKSIVVL